MIATLLALLFVQGSSAAWYVDDDAPAGGDGVAWGTAYRFLSDAIVAAAESGVPAEIHVAQGAYRPDHNDANPDGTGDRAASFTLVDGITIRGGYAGLGMPDPDERDPWAYETILSGDLLGDDGPNFANAGENSYHVVRGTDVGESAVLDGVVVTGGYADQGPDDHQGAGLLCFRASPTLIDCMIRYNFTIFQGAGMQNKEGSNPMLLRCLFAGNRSLDNGGAMYNGESRPTMIDCAFVGNTAVVYAGGVCNRDGSDALFERCLFTQNTAGELPTTGGGGGAMVNAFSDPLLVECTFLHNSAPFGKGGAIVNEPGFDSETDGSHPVISYTLFSANEAIFGGAVYNLHSEPVFTACTLVGNLAAGFFGRNAGGVMYNEESAPVLMSCLLSANEAARAGAIYDAIGDHPVLIDCTLEDNRAVSDSGGAVSVYYGELTVEGGSFARNTAATRGGAFSIFASVVHLGDVSIENNSADGSGGAVYAVSATTTLERCTLRGNSTDGPGGAVHNDQGSVTTLSDCLVAKNAATSGGGSWNHAASDVRIGATVFCVNTPDHIDGRYTDEGGNDFADACPSPCVADLDDNGVVDLADLLAIFDVWGSCPGCPEDLDESGFVDLADLLLLLAAWGPCP